MISFFGRAAAWFTLAALVTAAAQPAPRRYVIASSDTKAIQGLIDKAAQEGGGTLVVPAGTFVTGALFFKQGVNLSIEKGGVLIERDCEGTARERGGRDLSAAIAIELGQRPGGRLGHPQSAKAGREGGRMPARREDPPSARSQVRSEEH